MMNLGTTVREVLMMINLLASQKSKVLRNNHPVKLLYPFNQPRRQQKNSL
jgi:hypothetical protein